MKKSILFILCCLLATSIIDAQNYRRKVKKAKGIEVVYQKSYKGKVRPGEMLLTICNDHNALTALETISLLEKDKTNKETSTAGKLITRSFIDYTNLKVYNYAQLPNGQVISSESPFELNKGFKQVGQGEHLGLQCKILRTSINSNTIDVWYTNDIPFRGTPQSYVGIPDGLVLKVVRNGDQIEEATRIAPLKEEKELLPTSWGESMDAADFSYTIKQSGVITVSIFDQQTVCFNGNKMPETLEDNKQYSVGGGTIIMKKVKLPENIKDRDVFVELVQYSDGDAYDRTGSVFMIPTDKEQSFMDAMRNLKSVPAFTSENVDYHGLVSTDKYNTPLELMRFFTGFGVRKFNHNKVKGQVWVDSVLYKTEVTALSERLQGEVWMAAYIGNWDAKGHKVSLKLKYYPEGEGRKYHTKPLFNTVNYLEQAGQPYPIFMRNDSLKATFTIDKTVKDAILYYTTTGHGGWGGGDEFNKKPNTILLDGKKVITFIPWRDDCGTYRNNNPCSGNFSNGLSSSDLSRSNWCPGTVTNPEYIYLGDMEAGEHTITVKIPQGAPEGGSNSYWCVSGTLLYE